MSPVARGALSPLQIALAPRECPDYSASARSVNPAAEDFYPLQGGLAGSKLPGRGHYCTILRTHYLRTSHLSFGNDVNPRRHTTACSGARTQLSGEKLDQEGKAETLARRRLGRRVNPCECRRDQGWERGKPHNVRNHKIQSKSGVVSISGGQKFVAALDSGLATVVVVGWPTLALLTAIDRFLVQLRGGKAVQRPREQHYSSKGNDGSNARQHCCLKGTRSESRRERCPETDLDRTMASESHSTTERSSGMQSQILLSLHFLMSGEVRLDSRGAPSVRF